MSSHQGVLHIHIRHPETQLWLKCCHLHLEFCQLVKRKKLGRFDSSPSRLASGGYKVKSRKIKNKIQIMVKVCCFENDGDAAFVTPPFFPNNYNQEATCNKCTECNRPTLFKVLCAIYLFHQCWTLIP